MGPVEAVRQPLLSEVDPKDVQVEENVKKLGISIEWPFNPP